MKPWNQKVVVVTGGSAGLGWALTEHFAAAGATAVMVSRDPARLEERCRQGGESVAAVVADVTDPASVAAAVDEIVQRFGRIDVWINNVGISTRVALADCEVEQYREFLEINCLSAVCCTLAVLPQLEKTSGSVVNIGSLASKTAWPRVAPYVVSKHALAAFSQQVSLEGPANVHALLVCPGPIRRDDAGQRYSAEAAGLGAAAQQPGAGVRLKGLDPADLARRIDRAIQRRQRELVVPGKARWLFAISALWPRLGDWVLAKSSRR